MKIEINTKYTEIRLTGKHGKAIRIYHNEEDDCFQLSICQNGVEIGCLPSITFCKAHTICLNNLEKGESIIK